MTIRGFDISSWDDDPTTVKKIDFALLASKTRFIIARAGFGGWLDRDFLISWAEMTRLDIVRGAYWYLTDQVAAVTAARLFVQSVQADFGDFPPIVDFEPINWKDNIPKIAFLKAFVEEIYKLVGLRCMIYSGFYVWQDFGSLDAYWKKYDLWVANYGEKMIVPPPWTTAILWQFTDRTPAGADLGVESLGIDENFFIGDEAAFLNYTGQPASPGPLPDHVVTVESVTEDGVKVESLMEVTTRIDNDAPVTTTLDQRPPPPPPPGENITAV